MTHLTMQSMNGHIRHLRGLSGPLRITLEHMGDPGFGLGAEETEPDFGYPRVPEPLRPDEYRLMRRELEPGELFTTEYDAYNRSPLTPLADERNLPGAGAPLAPLPRRDYTTNYPHDWIAYEEMQAAVYPDQPPIPLGWAPIRQAALEKARALDLVGPAPWVPEDAQAYDISGFTSLQDMAQLADMGMLGQIYASPPDAASLAVAQQAAAAKAAGASPSLVNQIINFGASVGAFFINRDQQRQQANVLRRQQQLLEQQQAAAAAQAAAMGVPRQYVEPPSAPIYQHPLVIGGAVVASAGILGKVIGLY